MNENQKNIFFYIGFKKTNHLSIIQSNLKKLNLDIDFSWDFQKIIIDKNSEINPQLYFQQQPVLSKFKIYSIHLEYDYPPLMQFLQEPKKTPCKIFIFCKNIDKRKKDWKNLEKVYPFEFFNKNNNFKELHTLNFLSPHNKKTLEMVYAKNPELLESEILKLNAMNSDLIEKYDIKDLISFAGIENEKIFETINQWLNKKQINKENKNPGYFLNLLNKQIESLLKIKNNIKINIHPYALKQLQQIAVLYKNNELIDLYKKVYLFKIQFKKYKTSPLLLK